MRHDDAAAYTVAVRRVAPLNDSDVAAGLSRVCVRVLPVGGYLLREGERATDVAFVASGLLREYFLLPDGTERTKAFIPEGGFSGSLADLMSATPSRAFIVALEPTRMLVASYDDYQALARHSEQWTHFGRRSVDLLLLRKAEREYELLGLDAAARYAVFRERFPTLEARVSARHVASYLGITPVHLSRLRRRRRDQRRAQGGT